MDANELFVLLTVHLSSISDEHRAWGDLFQREYITLNPERGWILTHKGRLWVEELLQYASNLR